MQTENIESVKHESTDLINDECDNQMDVQLNNSSKDSSKDKVQSHNNRKRKNRRNMNKVDIKAKLERSRQSARECRARKKLRYQYLEDLVAKRECAILSLKKELDMYRDMCKRIDSGQTPHDSIRIADEDKRKNNRRA